jgi:hypothetical protein
MSEKRWVVDLSAEERPELLDLIRKGQGVGAGADPNAHRAAGCRRP